MLGVVIIAVVALTLSNRAPKDSTPQIEGPAISVLVMAEVDGESVLAAEAHIPDSGTALAALEEAALQQSTPLGIKEYPFGKLVVSIGGVTAGPDGDWTYRVNDTMVPVAANSMHLRDGDRLVFRFGAASTDSLSDTAADSI